MPKGLPIATIILFSLALLLPSAAGATDGRGAIRGCETNKSCTYNVNDDGSVDLDVVQADGSYNWVHCPPRGDCICKVCRTKGGNLTGIAGANKSLGSLGLQ